MRIIPTVACLFLLSACGSGDPASPVVAEINSVGNYVMATYNGDAVPAETDRTLTQRTYMLGGSIHFNADGTFEERRHARTEVPSGVREGVILVDGTWSVDNRRLMMLTHSRDGSVLFTTPATVTDTSIAFTIRVEVMGHAETFSFLYVR